MMLIGIRGYIFRGRLLWALHQLLRYQPDVHIPSASRTDADRIWQNRAATERQRPSLCKTLRHDTCREYFHSEENSGGPYRDRTYDTRIKRPILWAIV